MAMTKTEQNQMKTLEDFAQSTKEENRRLSSMIEGYKGKLSFSEQAERSLRGALESVKLENARLIGYIEGMKGLDHDKSAHEKRAEKLESKKHSWMDSDRGN